MTANLETAKAYFQYFTSGQIDDVLALWADDGVVDFHGEKPAKAFFPETAEFVATISFTLHQAYLAEDGQSVMLHFTSVMPSEDGTPTSSQGADVIKFNSDGQITHLTVIHG